MSDALYTRDILRLAVSIPYQQRLAHPDGSAELRSRTCGSVVAVDVMVEDDGALADMGLTVSACALGQASAAILGNGAIGRTAADIAVARARLESFFNGDADTPGGWQDMEILSAAKDHKGRHAAILLPFDTLIAALADAAKRKAA